MSISENLVVPWSLCLISCIVLRGEEPCLLLACLCSCEFVPFVSSQLLLLLLFSIFSIELSLSLILIIYSFVFYNDQ